MMDPRRRLLTTYHDVARKSKCKAIAANMVIDDITVSPTHNYAVHRSAQKITRKPRSYSGSNKKHGMHKTPEKKPPHHLIEN